MSTTDSGAPSALPGDHQVKDKGLRKGAIGLVSVLFMAIANAAPITAMSFNVPVGLGWGNGIGVPGGFLFATIVLTIFTIGFAAMSKHITTTGAFYGFISHGLGQVWGMAAGLLAALGYVLFEGTLIGGFSYFAADTLKSMADISINWLPIAIGGMLLIWVLTYFDITLAAAVLGVTLVSEVLLLLAFGISVLIKGGPDGFMPADTVSPLAGFKNLAEGAYGSSVGAGVAALGIFFAFWSWIGYETTAVYGEESKDPKTIVPKATLIAVVGLGLFYTFTSWMAVVANGAKAAVETAAGAAPVDVWLIPVKANLGSLPYGLYRILLVVGSFACAMAFHNAASRYVYAIGRELPSQKLRASIGGVSDKHQSPAVASTIVTVFNILMVVLFATLSTAYIADEAGNPVSEPSLIPYQVIYTVPSLVGTAFILVVQVLCSFAVIGYFWKKKVHKGSVLATLVAPLLGAAGMIYVLTLLFNNLTWAAGWQSGALMVKYLPHEIVGTLALGLIYAYWVKSKHPAIYEEIGRTTLEEAHERD
jgi:amino acid transporter